MKIRDRVMEIYPDNISTDRIVPMRLVTEVTPERLAPIAMKDVDERFHEKLEKGKIVVAGRNFGYASSREYAPLALRAAGVKAVIAKSFARIFFRNSINIGLPILECEDADKIKVGDEVEIDLKTGTISDLTHQFTLGFAPLPDFLVEWMTEGGMVKYLEKNKT
jgi:3-isopropylmalate/(R)-2-methylmalate dehydratase small subunit